MDSWQSGDVTVNGLRIHYTRAGDRSRPAVVLAHGFSDDGLCWTPIAETLSANYDVVMADARCHGQSAEAMVGYGQTDMASDLYGLITELGLQRPAVLGHSMGAVTTLLLAGLYPETPRAILLEDPPASWVTTPQNEEDFAKRWDGMRRWATGLKTKSRDELIEGQRTETPHWTDTELGPWADAKLRLSLNVFLRDPNTPVDWPAVLAQITCPTLLITGDTERGAIISPESAAVLQEIVPQTKIAHVPEAGHSIRRDQFDLYTKVVCDFLSDTLQ